MITEVRCNEVIHWFENTDYIVVGELITQFHK